MKRIVSLLLAVLLAAPSYAGWDKTKPATSSPLVSAEIRDNWAAIETLGGRNLAGDPTYRLWFGGTVGPIMWVKAGTGVAVSRTGTGLGDTTRKIGAFAALITSGSATATLEQNLLGTASYDDGFDGSKFCAGEWVKTSTATKARIYLADGAGTTFSSYHTGGGAFEWLTVCRTIDNAATKIVVGTEVAATSVAAYASGMTVVLGEIPPAYYLPAVTATGTFEAAFAGNLSTGENKFPCHFDVYRPGIVTDTHLAVITAPTTQAIIVDVKTYDGAAQTTMYSTRPQIAAGATRGSARPDGAYARRSFSFQSGTPLGEGGSVTCDIDQVGSGTVGADMKVYIRYLLFIRPLEEFRTYDEYR